MNKSYIMKYPGGLNFVRLDSYSGGYPSNTTWNCCHVWHNIDEAIKYANMSKNYNFEIYEVIETNDQITFKEVNIIDHICPCCGAIKNDSNH